MRFRDGERYSYARGEAIREALEDDRVVDSLVAEFQVPGTAARLRTLPRSDKLKAIEQQIEHFRASSTSRWFEGVPEEILAAGLWASDLPNKIVLKKLFPDVSREDDLFEPVAACLEASGLEVFDEVPTGIARVDVLGYRAGGWIRGEAVVAVELKNDLQQLKRGLDQMTTYSDYAHRVYLACTPALAAEFLFKHVDGRAVHHWDGHVLDRKLKKFGIGLLLVEGDLVAEHLKPTDATPSENKLKEVRAHISGMRSKK